MEFPKTIFVYDEGDWLGAEKTADAIDMDSKGRKVAVYQLLQVTHYRKEIVEDTQCQKKSKHPKKKK